MLIRPKSTHWAWQQCLSSSCRSVAQDTGLKAWQLRAEHIGWLHVRSVRIKHCGDALTHQSDDRLVVLGGEGEGGQGCL